MRVRDVAGPWRKYPPSCCRKRWNPGRWSHDYADWPGWPWWPWAVARKQSGWLLLGRWKLHYSHHGSRIIANRSCSPITVYVYMCAHMCAIWWIRWVRYSRARFDREAINEREPCRWQANNAGTSGWRRNTSYLWKRSRVHWRCYYIRLRHVYNIPAGILYTWRSRM